ncbi:hypothetical protein J437_LFUL002138 [Ladona fulva]|uniref:Cytochrome P450 n=1 Tax=Ladona fulva TaxID=123851 RepID=A0A8K0NU91_LADFU|nr:hypothetical protein J437_LFUL002138 [Ladona fulva]
MCQETDILIDRLGKLIQPQDEWSDVFDVVRYAKLCALDTTCKTIMGISAHDQDESEYLEYVTAIERITSILHQRFLTPWLRPEFLFNLSSLGREHARCIKITHAFSDKGHDTISSCFSWTLYLLGQNPEIQELCVQEIEVLLGEKLKEGEEITLRDLNSLEYMERCIKETLRLFPVIPIIGRDLKTPLKIKEHTLIPGTTVVVATYILHRDPKIFPNPEQFDPDRFCESNMKDRNPYAYTPFSVGSRNCIGE